MRKLKSNIQGFKEATFIQMGGRRGRDTVWCQEAVEALVAVEWVVPHSHVVDENREGYLGSKRSQPQARPHSPGFSNAGKIKPHNFWLYKPVRFGVMEETAGFSGESI